MIAIMPFEFLSSDDDDDSRAVMRGRIGLPAAGVVLAGLAAVTMLGLDGSGQFKGDLLDKAKLLVAGQRYEAVIQCGNPRKNGPGRSLLKGFLGANNHSLRAWNDGEARKKLHLGLKQGCHVTALYRLEKRWFSDRDLRYRI